MKRKLKQVTFTGVDKWTNLEELKRVQEEYPIIEFGILLSKNWANNGPRYMNPADLGKFKDQGLTLSGHLCGSIAREAVRDNWESVIELCQGNFDIFQRCQLNIVGAENLPRRLELYNIPKNLKEVIIQQHSSEECDFFLSGLGNSRTTVLLDGSGGRGINTGNSYLDLPIKVGYAGGIGPDNIVDKIKFLEENENVGPSFWIDMESSVRTDEKFDLNKIRTVMWRICDWYEKENKGWTP